ncbi:MAG: SDR family NAD(P)-dependent oxidoreductase [Chloroflexi bacterium AL-W]|nr:SDR family NAD(P)-dependent oxidoreductase [Chloroflexi bacterium AL-N1]NOK69937.1 SDR family NAD(P)-dependent oxidoreductase [Chloroflexi bacterium AL-N10]NOK73767.1 SDR family NAD(P)-dependent oxidoreductase [Chloroflexi bacterium AL-N5]NOK85469.1 SDR family NAD(P)-dependent oxidoreductase [Chloroflexi bacterium AL-W]NOK91670.1 SDR family NAD(P)-dependent oxidoreductase [Chloroflexi bacterium AL-N15]
MEKAVIWGVTGGIGRAIAQQLLSEGWQVLGIARDPSNLSDLDIPTYAADFARDTDVAAASLWIAQEVGEVNLWVYAAGDILAQTLSEMTMEEWTRLFNANTVGAHLAVQHSLPTIATRGQLVFIGAYVDRITLPRLGAYAAAKAALEAYTKVLTKEVRDRRITLLRVGAVETPLWDKVPFNPPRNGLLAPIDVANAILQAYKDGHKGVLDL